MNRPASPRSSAFSVLLFALSAPLIGACGDAGHGAGARAPEVVCPAGSGWNGENCVRTLVVTEVSCPSGARWDGARCVAASEVVCPAGSSFVVGQGCVAAGGAVSQVAQQDPSMWQSQSTSPVPAQSTPPQAPPPGSVNAKCACPAGDLMCVMKCTACMQKPTLGCITTAPAQPKPTSAPTQAPPPTSKTPF